MAQKFWQPFCDAIGKPELGGDPRFRTRDDRYRHRAELLAIIETRLAIGSQLQFARALSDAPGLVAPMLVVLLIGVLVDRLVFSTIEREVRRRHGLMEDGASAALSPGCCPPPASGWGAGGA